MPHAHANERGRPPDSLLAALAAERTTAQGLLLWAVTLLCLVILAGPSEALTTIAALAF